MRNGLRIALVGGLIAAIPACNKPKSADVPAVASNFKGPVVSPRPAPENPPPSGGDQKPAPKTVTPKKPADPAHPPEMLAIGKVAPDIVGEDTDGKAFKLSDYRGKVVVLDFWGHW